MSAQISDGGQQCPLRRVENEFVEEQSLGQRSKIKGSIQIQEVHVGLHSNA